MRLFGTTKVMPCYTSREWMVYTKAENAVALVHRDEKAGDLFWNEVAADRPWRLSPLQSRGHAFLPAIEAPFQSDFCLLTFLNFVKLSPNVYEKLEKQSLEPFWDRLRRLLVRHSSSISEVLDLLYHVIVVNVEHRMLLQFSFSRNL